MLGEGDGRAGAEQELVRYRAEFVAVAVTSVPRVAAAVSRGFASHVPELNVVKRPSCL